MIATSAGGMGFYGSTGPVSGDGTMRAIVEGQGLKESLGFNPPKPPLGSRQGLQHWMKLTQVGLGDEIGGVFNGFKYRVESNG